MEFGICMFATDYSMQPADLAVAVEERGFDALFIPDHTHMPATRDSAFRMGGEPPPDYSHNLDMFLALAAAAAVTTRIRLGTGICLVVERDPIVTAKEVATLDVLSNGRFLFGVGGGWNVEEMANHGTEFTTRWKLLRERIEAMKAIWTQEEADYQGELVSFEPIWSNPKPRQKPHPPILLGGHGTKALERVVRYCDGWMPIGPLVRDFAKSIRTLRELAGKVGRDPQAISVSAMSAPADEKVIASWAEAGVERVVFPLPPAPADKVLPKLDQYAKLLAR